MFDSKRTAKNKGENKGEIQRKVPIFPRQQGEEKLTQITSLFRYTAYTLCYLLLVGFLFYFAHVPMKELKNLPVALTEAVASLFRVDWAYFPQAIYPLAQSMGLSFLASFFAYYLSFIMASLQSPAFSPSKYLAYTLAILASFLRAIPSLVWAAILVSLFSIGSLAGFFALLLILTLMGTKLFREQILEIKEEELLWLTTLSLSKGRQLIHFLLPKLAFQGQAIFAHLLETALRSSVVLGLVGAGGFGVLIQQNISFLRFDRLATLIWLLLVVVGILEFFLRMLRKHQKEQIFSYHRFYLRHVLLFLLALLTVHFSFTLELSRLVKGSARASQFLLRMIQPDWSYLPQVASALLESIAMALLASLLAGLFTYLLLPFCISYFSPKHGVYLICKILAQFLRTFPPLLLALVFFKRLGPGPLAGILAMFFYTLGVQLKHLGEICEEDSSLRKMQENFSVLGVSSFRLYYLAFFSTIKGRFYSFFYYRLEANLRNSTLLGLVGAGGIGYLLQNQVLWRNWEKVGILLLAIALVNVLLDLLSYFRQKRSHILK